MAVNAKFPLVPLIALKVTGAMQQMKTLELFTSTLALLVGKAIQELLEPIVITSSTLAKFA